MNWTPINRGQEADSHIVRKTYLENLEKRFKVHSDDEEDEDEATSKQSEKKIKITHYVDPSPLVKLDVHAASKGEAAPAATV